MIKLWYNFVNLGGLPMSELIKIDHEYAKWIKEISVRFKISQISAATKVNVEMLRFYWQLGKEIGEKENANKYGTSFYKSISLDLQSELPDVKSFSVTNLKYMNYFYELYSNRQQLVDDCDDIIFRIPWGHHVQILGKCKGNQDKALFFVKKTIENNWSRAVLMNFLGTNLYEREGKAITNFKLSLPAIQSDLALSMTKDPYNFDFLTLRENYNERQLKDALMDNIQKFLLELGKGFAFVGREYRLMVGQSEQFLDMLFYNIFNHCYVVVEIKIRDFEPGDMGQLGTYVAAVDGILKHREDNQTIGLLICKTKDNVLAQYAVNVMNAPIGISEYQLSNLIPEKLKDAMPSIEAIERELKD